MSPWNISHESNSTRAFSNLDTIDTSDAIETSIIYSVGAVGTDQLSGQWPNWQRCEKPQRGKNPTTIVLLLHVRHWNRREMLMSPPVLPMTVSHSLITLGPRRRNAEPYGMISWLSMVSPKNSSSTASRDHSIILDMKIMILVLLSLVQRVYWTVW